MKRVAVLAEKYHCAIILIGHMNKNSNGKSSYRGLGSIDFQAAARSVLIVGRIKDLLNDDSCTEDVKKGLEQKMNTMVERELYTKSKTAPTEEEREKARQEYLNRRGIQADFRW